MMPASSIGGALATALLLSSRWINVANRIRHHGPTTCATTTRSADARTSRASLAGLSARSQRSHWRCPPCHGRQVAVINTSERLKRVSVTDPAVADIDVVTPTQVQSTVAPPAKSPLLIWDELERSRSFDLWVRRRRDRRRRRRKERLPDEQITVTPSRSGPSCFPPRV